MLLSNNNGLYQFLLSLKDKLIQQGAIDLSQMVTHAISHASEIPQTPFLGESRIALKKVAETGEHFLTTQQYADVLDVIKQLDAAFKNNG